MKKLFALTMLLFYASFSFACSTFLLSKDGHYVFGRNYDWVSGNGMLVVNARGVQKTSLVGIDEKTVSWTSKYGSISFNQFGKEFPHGGMNEKGLVIELMWLDGTGYPAKDNRGALSELQWIQYQLDNCATVTDVIASDKTVRIENNNATPLHFLVADGSGKAATIEFINGKLVAHTGKELNQPVLTNTKYTDAVKQVAQNKSGGFEDNSVERFATACNLVKHFSETKSDYNIVDYAFDILSEVAQGDYTKWKIVYDISKKEIYFTTGGNRKQLSLSAFDFNCKTTSLYLDVNTMKTGVVASFFAPLSFEQNKKSIQQSAEESKSQITISEKSINASADYFKKVKCGG
jgi:penicillin V acylase-like amidase (Ntn superfamily)